MTEELQAADQDGENGPVIDVGVIDTLFAQLDSELINSLLENCFAEFDQQIELFKDAGARGDRAGCLTSLHRLRGVAVDYGALALSHEITVTKNALLNREYQQLANCITRLTEVHRDTRSALLMRLAKCTATQLGHKNDA